MEYLVFSLIINDIYISITYDKMLDPLKNYFNNKDIYFLIKEVI